MAWLSCATRVNCLFTSEVESCRQEKHAGVSQVSLLLGVRSLFLTTSARLVLLSDIEPCRQEKRTGLPQVSFSLTFSLPFSLPLSCVLFVFLFSSDTEPCRQDLRAGLPQVRRVVVQRQPYPCCRGRGRHSSHPGK